MNKDAPVSVRKRILRVLLWMLLVVVSLPVLAVLLFQTAPVQDFVRAKATDFLRNKFHTHVSIGQIRLSWWNSVLLKKVYLGDTRDQPLLYSGSLEARFNLLGLLRNKLVVYKLDWEDVLLNVYRREGDTAYNYQFIITAFSSPEAKEDTAAGKPLAYSIGNISLKDFRLRYLDEPGGMNITAKWNTLLIDPKEIEPHKGIYTVNNLEWTGLRSIIQKKEGTGNVQAVATVAVDQLGPDNARGADGNATRTDHDARGAVSNATGGDHDVGAGNNAVGIDSGRGAGTARLRTGPEEPDTAAAPLRIGVERLALNDCGIWYRDDSSALNTGWRIKGLAIRDASFNAVQTAVKAEAIDLDVPGGIFDRGGGKAPGKKGTMDFDHLLLTGIRLRADDIYYSTDSMQLRLNELAVSDRSGFSVQKGAGDLLYTDKAISARNLLLQTRKSRISGETLLVQTPSFAAIAKDSKLLRNNPGVLQIKANISDTYLDMPELGSLLPDLRDNPSLQPIFRKRIQLDGDLSGSMALLQLNRIRVADRNGTDLRLSGTVSHVTDPDRLMAVLKQIDIQSGERSIRSWLPAGTIPDSISLPSRLRLLGSATYSRRALQAGLRLNSSLGNIILNGWAADYMDKNKSRYVVQVPLMEMDLGKLLMDTTLGPVNISFSADGRGYDYKTLSAQIELAVKEAYYKGYRYHAISSTADLKAGDYALALVSKDTNVLASAQLAGRIDSLKSNIKGNLELQRLDLYATHWSATPFQAKAGVMVDMKDLQPRKLNGDIVVSGIQLADDSALYALDSVHLVARDSLDQQQIALSSPFGNITAKGDFDYTTAFTDLTSLFLKHLQPAGGNAVPPDSSNRRTAYSPAAQPVRRIAIPPDSTNQSTVYSPAARNPGRASRGNTNPVNSTKYTANSTNRSANSTSRSVDSGQSTISSSSPTVNQRQQMVLEGELKWPRSLKRLAPSLQMNQPLIIHGRLNTDSSLAAFSFLLADLGYQDFRVDTLRGSIQTNVDSMAGTISLSRLLHPRFPLERTTISVNAANGLLETDITLLDKAKRTKYAVGSLVRFLPENTFWLSLKPKLILNKDTWQVSDSNKIVLKNGALQSAALSISEAGQLISVSTKPEAGSSPALTARIESFRLSTLSALLEQDSLFAEGVAGGEAEITGLDKQPLINARLTIDSLRMMNTSIGNLTAEVATPAPGAYSVNAGLTGNGNDVAIKGTYGSDLAFNVDLNRLNMSAMEPLTMGAVKRMSGVTTGQLSLKGTTDAPQIRGTLVFDSVAASVSAIGSYLKLPHNELVLDERGILLNNFIIEDSLNNMAEINGRILTRDYSRFRFQLDLLADHFMAIGPKVSGEQMIYGPSFVDAEAKITGTNLLPRVDLKLTLRDSSDFTIVLPESEPGIADREGVIVFVDKDNQPDSSLLRIQDTVAIHTPPAFQGLAMTAQIEFTPKSTIRVVIDQQNGDYLEVKGKANLDAVLSPTADPSVTGRYEIDEGSYNLSLNNLIKRKFTIEKGSTITLPGEITQAVVDITARYRVEAVAGDLVEDQLSGASDTRKTQFRQKVPVDVYLLIKNEMLKPDISFRLDMPEKDRNTLNGVIYSRIKQINQVESELNKQVMGLLVLNSFIPENPLALLNERGGGVEGTARKSVSKLISQQLNNFAGSLIKGFDVNFDLESGEDYSTGKAENRTDLSIGVSKSLFNDRLSVSVGSSVNLEGPQQAQQASTLVGDVAVDYKITPDGRYRLRAYRQNETDAIVEGQIVETGASFIYTVDYNEFRELLHRMVKKEKKKQIKKKKQESP